MAKLSLRHIYKVYPSRDKQPSIFKRLLSKNKIVETPKDFVAVKDFNLEIDDGEFVVFVGPSGCGKSTTLRMIAGLEDISAGELYMDDILLNNVDPMNRDMAMVFQSYALYPHLSVYENIAFGLKMRKIDDVVLDKDGNTKSVKRHYTKKEIDEKVNWAANILGIENLLNRKPSEMSGGQCQRVALGRALVRGPKLFLLDEPLSNLDAKLRTSMRSEIVKLHQRLKTTFIYVTHDQVEAMTMGTKIVVMKDGIIQQIDKPTDLFNYPNNIFVAGFIGTPQMNFFDVTIKALKKTLHVEFNDSSKQSINLDLNKLRPIDSQYLDGNPHQVVLGTRAEHLLLNNKDGIKMNISIFEVLGSTTHLFVRFENDEKEYIVSTMENNVWENGQQINISFDEQKVHLFDKNSGESILGGH